MNVLSYLKYPLLVVLTSFFFFPFEFTFLPGLNTKMALAALGLVLFVLRLAKYREASISKDLLVSAIYASIVSLLGVCSVVYNSTTDWAYASYIVSFFVWMGGAFFVVSAIGYFHGKTTLLLMINYLIAVCVAQCIAALLINWSPSIRAFVDSFLAGEGFMGKMQDRMYGIGAALDVAGEKFGCVLVAISFVVMNEKKLPKQLTIIYWISYLTIAVIGNMIGRTTTVGLILSLIYIVGKGIFSTVGFFKSRIIPLFTTIVVLLPVLIYLYNHNSQTREDLRFAFEGFFSIVENGRWETNSNNYLRNMVVLPDNVKTWIIGDGYFDNPYSDPYYNGDNPTAFYKGTDVGYLRFIFYFGVVGLISFFIFFFVVCWRCIIRHRSYAILFLLLLLINYIVWFKVSSDIFLIFSLFLCIPSEEEMNQNEVV